MTSRASQVGPCTPLVTEPIGTSSASKPSHSPPNMPRDTAPCSWDTPLARWASRRPMCAMLNMPGFVLGAEREDPVHRHAGQQRMRSPSAPK